MVPERNTQRKDERNRASAGALTVDDLQTAEAAFGNAVRAGVERSEVGRRNCRKTPEPCSPRGTSALVQDIRGSNIAPSNRADVASDCLTESIGRWKAEARPPPSTSIRIRPVKQAELCAGASSVSRKIYTISRGRLPGMGKSPRGGIFDGRLLCRAGDCGVEFSLEVGNFLFGVGDGLLFGVDLILLVLHCGGACFVG